MKTTIVNLQNLHKNYVQQFVCRLIKVKGIYYYNFKNTHTQRVFFQRVEKELYKLLVSKMFINIVASLYITCNNCSYFSSIGIVLFVYFTCN